jgi:hypothetical protein
MPASHEPLYRGVRGGDFRPRSNLGLIGCTPVGAGIRLAFGQFIADNRRVGARRRAGALGIGGLAWYGHGFSFPAGKAAARKDRIPKPISGSTDARISASMTSARRPSHADRRKALQRHCIRNVSVRPSA